MLINKIGALHLEYGANCQDAGRDLPGLKIVCDGCSEGLHSEVGSKLFTLYLPWYLERYISTNAVERLFGRLADFFDGDPDNMKHYLSFTILIANELPTLFLVSYCGDGYIIAQRNDGEIEFIKIDCGDYPEYYIYNFIPKNRLSKYHEGVAVHVREFRKSEYRRIGVASDGLRYALEDDEIRPLLIQYLKEDKPVKIKRLINKYQHIFKDDITIAF